MAALIAKRRTIPRIRSAGAGQIPAPAPMPFAVFQGKTTAHAPFLSAIALRDGGFFPRPPIFFQDSFIFRRGNSLVKSGMFCNG